MLTYALIGLGGAIGSMLRAGLSAAMTALTGPAFPWGTILINVVGSFVIGFFGTLTATDGRFAVPPGTRAFVMVGLCGGFTTFSSFSLQTFDLLRDGRIGQALANVALSVLLCLGIVAAGCATARAVRIDGPVRLGDAAPGSLGDSTLIVLHRPEAVRPMLAMASRLMAPRHDRATALAIDGPVLAPLLPSEEVLTRERRDAIASAHRDWVVAMTPALDAWVAASRAEGREARWIEIAGEGTREILEHGRGAHLLLLEHRPGDRGDLARIRTALGRASRPVVLVPPDTGGEIGRVVAVAWRDAPQARRAVAAARPILSRAERVVVLQMSGTRDDDALPPDLFGGLPVERWTVPDAGDGVGRQILEAAHASGADLLVMGSYDQGRTEEALFGGVTEEILRLADLPVLLQPVGV